MSVGHVRRLCATLFAYLRWSWISPPLVDRPHREARANDCVPPC